MAVTTKASGRLRFLGSGRVDRAINILTILVVLILIVGVVLWRIPSKYQILLPTSAESVDPKLYVSGHPAPTGRGQFYMSTVQEPDTSLLLEIFGRLNPDSTIEAVPTGYSNSQQLQAGRQEMLSSTQTAELVALCRVGYAKLCDGGVLVLQIEANSKANGVLKPSDIILQVNGVRTVTPTQLRATLGRSAPGSTVRVTFRRGSATSVRTIATIASPDQPIHAILGVGIDQAPAAFMPDKLPIDLKIDPGQIGGPSAGLIFTLGLLNRLSPTDLTHGCKIGGTGTIGLDGAVGAIGGVKQKIIGAKWAGVRYYFIPYDQGNYDEARKYAGKLQLVSLHNLDEALSFLHSLRRTATDSCARP